MQQSSSLHIFLQILREVDASFFVKMNIRVNDQIKNKLMLTENEESGWETATQSSNDITLWRATRSRVGRAGVGWAQTKQAMKYSAGVPASKLVRD